MSFGEMMRLFWPETILLSAGFLALVLDLLFPVRKWTGYFMLAATGAALVALCLTPHPEGPVGLFFGYFIRDPFSIFFAYVTLSIVFLTLLMTIPYKGIPEKQQVELYALIAFISVGLIMMASSANLLMIFLSIEFVSITSYILSGFQKYDKKSNEASLKYLLFGSVASGVMLYGISLLFGLSGSIELTAVREAAVNATPLFTIAMTFFMTGLAFKISAVPFHMWAPDVYTGAPTPVAAFFTVGPKALGFAVLLRVLTTVYPQMSPGLLTVIATMSALTMTVGNVIAVSQNDIKRLLAYSSIGQAGYILMGVAAFNEIGLSGALFYLAAYALTNLGAFAVAILVANATGSYDIDAFAGLSKRAPFAAVAMTVFLISLAGIPPLAGYIGKFYVFAAAMQGKLWGLAVIAAVNTALAAYYYFKVVKRMYFTDAPSASPIAVPVTLKGALLLTFAGVLIFGLFPAPLIEFVNRSVSF